MASPFPGMDPYLEDNSHWRGFHHHLAEEIVRHLNPIIVPKYYAEVDVHSVLQELTIAETQHVYPDVNIIETQPQPTSQRQAVVIPEAPLQRAIEIPEPMKRRAVNIYLTETKTLVTAIELLSPANKSGGGLAQYRRKRDSLLRSEVHLVEIDLLRSGQRPGPEVNEPPIETDYVILLNRAEATNLRLSKIWPVSLAEPLPTIPVPLRAPDPDVPLPLPDIFDSIYATHYYQYRLDYSQPVPAPSLRPEMQTWFDAQEFSR